MGFTKIGYCLLLVGVVQVTSQRVGGLGSRHRLPPEENLGNVGDRLVLTPFLNNGSARVGREFSRVKNMVSTESYSGFVIVNSTYNSHLFFWFFPAQVGRNWCMFRLAVKLWLNYESCFLQHQPKTAPIILWLGGGPGVTAMYGLFNSNGPIYVDAKYGPHRRENPWSLTHSMLYIDSLVGAGETDKSSDKDLTKILVKARLNYVEISRLQFHGGWARLRQE